LPAVARVAGGVLLSIHFEKGEPVIRSSCCDMLLFNGPILLEG
jgi:hypothetical protein